MANHDLKTWPEFFAAVRDGSKTFEIRADDRGFAVGDVLRLVSPDFIRPDECLCAVDMETTARRAGGQPSISMGTRSTGRGGIARSEVDSIFRNVRKPLKRRQNLILALISIR